MFDTDDTFRAQVAASPELQARWHTITDQLISEAREKLGVELEKQDLASLSAVKLFVYTGEMIGDALEQCQKTLPAMKKAVELRELREAISREDHANHESALEALNSKSPAERMRLARESGATLPGAESGDEPEPMAPNAKAAALARLSNLRGSARIAEARRLGLS